MSMPVVSSLVCLLRSMREAAQTKVRIVVTMIVEVGDVKGKSTEVHCCRVPFLCCPNCARGKEFGQL